MRKKWAKTRLILSRNLHCAARAAFRLEKGVTPVTSFFVRRPRRRPSTQGAAAHHLEVQ